MSSVTALAADGVTVTVDDVGSRITSLCVGGSELLVTTSPEPLAWGCYPMVPWAGRLGGATFEHDGRRIDVEATAAPHALHGLGIAERWARIDDRTRTLDLSTRWPLGGTATSEVELRPDALSLTLTLTAAGTSMPAGLGWHPCFVREIDGHAVRLDLDATHMWPRGPDGLPTGSVGPLTPGPWDDCFGGVTRPPVLSWGPHRRVSLHSRTTTWVVYDEDPTVICVEPQTAPPDSFHQPGHDVVPPGGSLSIGLEIRW